MTKICDFPQPISDLTKNSMPYLLLEPLINTLFNQYPDNQLPSSDWC